MRDRAAQQAERARDTGGDEPADQRAHHQGNAGQGRNEDNRGSFLILRRCDELTGFAVGELQHPGGRTDCRVKRNIRGAVHHLGGRLPLAVGEQRRYLIGGGEIRRHRLTHILKSAFGPR